MKAIHVFQPVPTEGSTQPTRLALHKLPIEFARFPRVSLGTDEVPDVHILFGDEMEEGLSSFPVVVGGGTGILGQCAGVSAQQTYIAVRQLAEVEISGNASRTTQQHHSPTTSDSP